MKTKLVMPVVLPAAIIFATSAFAGEVERIRWTDVPPAVQKTITDNAGGGKIEEIEKETNTQKVRILHFDGAKTVTVYEAEVEKPNGKEISIRVSEDGKLIKIENQSEI
jgi:ribulose bisphosphate carboxylase small subunit